MSRSPGNDKKSLDSDSPTPGCPIRFRASSDLDLCCSSENDLCSNKNVTNNPNSCSGNQKNCNAESTDESLSSTPSSVTEYAPVYANLKSNPLIVNDIKKYSTGDVEDVNNFNVIFTDKPAEEDSMGNIFGRKKKKKENDLKVDEDGDLWKRRDTNDSTTSSSSGKNKLKDKKKSKNRSKTPESPSVTRAKSNSLKGKDSKDRYAVYEPDKRQKTGNCHTLPARVDKSRKNASNTPVRKEPSEFRKSIGDPMDFKMADDVSSAGSPGYATPDTATPPATRTALFRNLNQRDKCGVDHSGHNTPHQTPKMAPKFTPNLLKREKTSESSDDSKYSTGKVPLATPSPSLTPKFSPHQKQKNEASILQNSVSHGEGVTGSPRPRGYILPSPPTRPKFVNKGTVNEIPESPKLLRSGKHRLHADDVLLEKSGSIVKEKLIGCCDNKEVPIYQSINKTNSNARSTNTRLKEGSESRIKDSNTFAGTPVYPEPVSVEIQVEDENEINMRKEELRKMAILSAGCDTEVCQTIRETVIESIQPNLIDTEKYEVTAGPKIAVLSTIPPPEKAVISLVPPPSPSSMGVLCEEEEEEKEEEGCNTNRQTSHRLSKEVEEFGDIVCQRLSQLLENQEDNGSLRTHGNTRLIATSDSISPQSPGLAFHRGGGTDSDARSDSSNMQSENLYKEKQIPETFQVMERNKLSLFQCSLEQPTIIAKCPRGVNDASVMDMANNNYRLETIRDNSHDPQRGNVVGRQGAAEDTGSESDISSSESSYTSESEYTSDGGLGLQDEDREPDKDETVYSVPWDLNRYRTDSNTDEGLDFSDDPLYDQSENVARSIGVNQCSVKRDLPPSVADYQSQGYRKYIKTIGAQKPCNFAGEHITDSSDAALKQEALEKHLKEIFDMRYTSMESVNEQHIEPITIKRELNLPRNFTNEEYECEVIEEEIKPRYSDPTDKMCIQFPKRESDILCDVIDAYTGDDDVEKRKSVKQKVQDFEDLTVEQMAEAKKPSALDKSIQRIFLEQEVEELYPELAPLHSLIQDAMDTEPSCEPYPVLKEGDIRNFSRLPLAHKRFGSSTFTESDLDMSEQRDDVSSDSMDADDEDEEGGLDDDSRDSEALFSKPYSRKLDGGKILVKRAVLSSNAFRETVSETDNDSVFLDEDDLSHSDHRHWRQREVPSPEEEEFERQRWRSEELSSVDEFAYEHHEQEHRQWQHHELPPTPLSAPPFFSIPPPPPQPPSPTFSDEHPRELDLASTYLAMGPPIEAAGVAFDDARKQMEDIHVHLQNLREQITHLHGDEDLRNQSRYRRDVHDTRRVYTD